MISRPLAEQVGMDRGWSQNSRILKGGECINIRGLIGQRKVTFLQKGGTVKKPEWAEHWAEETFDFGFEKAYAAVVGPMKNAVRVHSRKCVTPPTYKYEMTTDSFWCEDCDEYHEFKHVARVVDTPGVYEDVEPLSESEVHTVLEDWFKNKANECREFIRLAEDRGW